MAGCRAGKGGGEMSKQGEAGLTEEERNIIQILADAKRHFIQLPSIDDTSLGDFLGALYRAENEIVLRVRLRAEKANE